MALFGEVYARRTLKVGITSLTKGAGATHFAIAVANYISSKEKMDVNI